MSGVQPNPYAPPATESFPEQAVPSLDALGEFAPLTFSGSITEKDVVEYLRAHGHVGGGRILMLACGLVLLLVVLSAWAAAAAIAFVGLATTVFAASTLPYRRRVFANLNPQWNQPVRGEITIDGVHRERGGCVTAFRWDWFSGAAMNENIVALIPATQSAQPLILSREMLAGPEQWFQLQQVADAVGLVTDDDVQGDLRREQNLRLLHQRRRPRSIDVPGGAVAFEGLVTDDDFARVPRRFRRRERPLRAYVLNTLLAGFGLLFLASISVSILGHFLLLPAIVLAYAVPTVYFGRRRRRISSGRAIYYINAFANESGLVADFAITAIQFSWPALEVTVREDDLVVLRRRESNQIILVRRNMFGQQDDWERFCDLVRNGVEEVVKTAGN